MTEIYEEKPWTEKHERTCRMLYKHILTIDKEADDETFIDIYRDKLIKIIKGNDKWKDSTTETVYFTIERYFY